MDYRPQADRLLAGLAEAAGSPGLKLDENGALLARIGGTLFSFHYDRRLEALFIQADGGSVRDASPEVLEKTLAGNFLWRDNCGGVWGLDDEDNLNLAYRLDFPLARSGEEEGDYDRLLVDLLAYLNGAVEWARDTAAD